MKYSDLHLRKVTLAVVFRHRWKEKEDQFRDCAVKHARDGGGQRSGWI